MATKAKKAAGTKAAGKVAKVEAKAAPVPKPEATKAPPAPAKAANTDKEKAPAKATTAMRDPRLPAPGTVIERSVAGKVHKIKFTETDAVICEGTTYRTISGCAKALNEAAGLSGAVNGYLWAGIIKAPSAVDPMEALAKALARVAERAPAALEADKAGAVKALKAHLAAIAKLTA